MSKGSEEVPTPRMAAFIVAQLKTPHSNDWLWRLNRTINEAKSIERENIELRRNLDEAVKDTDRLDWVISHPRSLDLIKDRCPYHTSSIAGLRDIRSKIDAAMTKKGI